MPTGYVNINGVTFESGDVYDEATATALVSRLLGEQAGLRDVQRVQVTVDGRAISLHVRPALVWSSAAWLSEH